MRGTNAKMKGDLEMNENCRFVGKRGCAILKQLYCKNEPNKQCAFYIPFEKNTKSETVGRNKKK